jgi:membrane-associated phospholipid phosphatase
MKDSRKNFFSQIFSWDDQMAARIRLGENQILLRKFAAFFAHSGDSWFLLAGLFVLWIFSKGSTHKYAALFAGAIIIQASLVIGIKFLIKRRRPEGEWGSIYRNTDPNSFPSGHAVRVVMLALMAFGLNITPLQCVLMIWAPMVSFARIMLGVHYLTDVLAGWILGAVLAAIILKLQLFFYQMLPFAF